MADASTVQLLASALGGGVLVGVMNAGLRLGEFRREDRARWVQDRRAAYASYVEGVNCLLAECAPLSVAVAVAQLHDADDTRRHASEIAQAAYEHWIMARPHEAVLRLLANKAGLEALKALDAPLVQLVTHVFAVQIGGSGDEDTIRDLAARVDLALEKLIRAARRDIGA